MHQFKPLLFIVVCSFFLPDRVLCQTIKVEGSVLNANTGESVPFATIGIKNKNAGTIADANGAFAFTLTAESVSSNEEIVVSCVGYESKRLSLSSFDNGPKSIELLPSVISLNEVVVKPHKVKRRVIGKNDRSILTYLDFYSAKDKVVDDKLGREMGVILNFKQQCMIEDFNLYVSTNEFKLVKFRLNLYRVENGRPAELVQKKDIIFDIAGRKTGWISIDLRQYDITISGSVAVTIQWILSEAATDKSRFLSVSATPADPFHFYVSRDKSQDKWSIKKGNLSFYCNAQCLVENSKPMD